MGNSEVGHLNLGAGQIVPQDLKRIDDAVQDGSFFENEVLRDACAAAREAGRLHLLGLVSAGGVHASMDHLDGAASSWRRARASPTSCCTRSPTAATRCPTRAPATWPTMEGWLAEHGGRVATVTGRYYAMDRDRREERTQMAYDALVRGEAEGRHCESGEDAVRAAYERGETDEFVMPTLVGEEGRIRDGDAVVFFNFRPDRARQLTEALTPSWTCT